LNRIMEMVHLVLQESEGIQEWEEFRLEMREILMEQGYQPLEINLALAIAQKIHEQLADSSSPGEPLRSNRIFQLLEEQKLTPKSRGYLDELVRQGYISPEARMDVVDRMLMLEESAIDVDELKQMIEMFVDEEGPDEDNFWLPPTIH
jgi:uncharacterized protein Smg (DUF494 family)